jgi:flagellar biosynthesis protein FlhG
MSDQAERLRQLAGVAATRGDEISPKVNVKVVPGGAQRDCRGGAHSLLFTSGKGGVGTSNMVLNLAIVLGEMNARVVVVDADIGLANLDLLCGFYPRYDLGDVLLGRCEVSDAVVPGPRGIHIVAGAHASRTSMSDLGDGAGRLASELAELAFDFDFVLIDAGSGLGPCAATLAAAADEAVVVTTPEPTSVADAHAAISRFHQAGISRLRVLINQAASDAEAELVLDGIISASRQFKGAVVSPLGPGFVRVDRRVPMAVRSRRPFVTAFPAAVASRGVRRLAQAVFRERHPPERKERPGFRAAIAARWRCSAAIGS